MRALLRWALPWLTAVEAGFVAGLLAHLHARRADEAGGDPLTRLRDAGRLRDCIAQPLPCVARGSTELVAPRQA